VGIKFCFKLGWSATRNIRHVRIYFWKEGNKRTKTFEWFLKFTCGTSSVEDADRLGHCLAMMEFCVKFSFARTNYVCIEISEQIFCDVYEMFAESVFRNGALEICFSTMIVSTNCVSISQHLLSRNCIRILQGFLSRNFITVVPKSQSSSCNFSLFPELMLVPSVADS
jgi:hypothetical protein